MTHTDVLVINAGSSSLKVSRRPLGHTVVVERLGDAPTWRSDAPLPPPPPLPDVGSALAACLGALARRTPLSGLEAVAHRIVHGGERYAGPILLDDDAVASIEALTRLAPLHLPANLAGVRAARTALPDLPHIGVFDTAFHAHIAPRAYRYGVPKSWYEEHGVRRYGFHGPSHDGVTRRAAELLGRPLEELRMVSLHLGNGASAAAVQEGRSVDTSMGLTPLDGLVMGTRPGSLDPGVLLHLLNGGMPLAELDDTLQRRSGLLGLSGRSNDVRDLRAAEEAGDADARLALEVFCYRVRTTLGAMAFAMGGLDAIVFTGGIGEHDAATRRDALADLHRFGIQIDPVRNATHGPRIDADGAAVAVVVVATDEEGMMAEAARELLHRGGADAAAPEGTRS
ncbi:MAG: acetate/propionate family kinase [Trueperaceae bacterium]|nr:acetate/propionate family kinase [Trueperaceae bacterium]